MSQTTTTPAAPAPGSPEHDAAMAAVAQAARAEGQPGQNEIDRAASAPDSALAGIPEKFIKDGVVDVAALAKSYTELEKARSGPKPPAAPTLPTDPAKPAEPVSPATQSDAEKAVAAAGLDWDALSAKAARGEAFSDDEYAALEAKANMPRHVADMVATSLTARVAQEKAAAVEYAGGQAQADRLLSWAAENLNEGEKAAINLQLASANWRLAIDALKARSGAALPTAGEPNLTTGVNGVGSTAGYRSKAEMKLDMGKPEYAKDPAFRERVATRMRFATWDLDNK